MPTFASQARAKSTFQPRSATTCSAFPTPTSLLTHRHWTVPWPRSTNSWKRVYWSHSSTRSAHRAHILPSATTAMLEVTFHARRPAATRSEACSLVLHTRQSPPTSAHLRHLHSLLASCNPAHSLMPASTLSQRHQARHRQPVSPRATQAAAMH